MSGTSPRICSSKSLPGDAGSLWTAQLEQTMVMTRLQQSGQRKLVLWIKISERNSSLQPGEAHCKTKHGCITQACFCSVVCFWNSSGQHRKLPPGWLPYILLFYLALGCFTRFSQRQSSHSHLSGYSPAHLNHFNHVLLICLIFILFYESWSS